jgi:RimJ/RimL family protein N-acetyltransferase
MRRAGDLRGTALTSMRLTLRAFSAADAADVSASVTPTLTRFMAWEPSPSLEAFAEVWRAWLHNMEIGSDAYLVARLAAGEFIGMVGLHDVANDEPEIGIWIKETSHRLGYGREAVVAVIDWAAKDLAVRAFFYPVVARNRPSRRLAESLGGVLVGTRQLHKPSGTLDEVVYEIQADR